MMAGGLMMASAATGNTPTASISQFAGLERYTNGSQRPSAPRPWQYQADDGTYYLQLSAGGKKIVKYETKTGKEIETLFDVDNTRETTLPSIEGFEISRDGRKIMVYTDQKMIYRHSTDAVYYVYDCHSRTLKPLSDKYERQRMPLMSPDGRIVAFVGNDNNIHLRKMDYWTEVDVTTDGAVNQTINGVPDWVYEEEFSTDCSMAWAPDNLTLSFLKYDESQVPLYSMSRFVGACIAMTQYALYPGQFTYKYPVAGEPNSKVTLHSYDVETRKVKDIELPDSRIEYIPRITYGPTAEQLMVVTLNREQTRMELYSVNPKSTVSRSILVEEHKAWLSTATYEDIYYGPDFMVVTSSRTGYDHLYQYSYTGQLQATITSGNWDVTAYYGYNAQQGLHYFQSTATGAINRVVSSIDRKGKMTHLTPEQGYARATFAPGMNYYIVNYNSTSTPNTFTLYAAGQSKALRTLEDNADYKRNWAGEPQREFFTMTSQGVTLNGYMLKPNGFDPSRKYPVIMYQYSGPGSQQVLNQWSVSWMNYYVSQGYIIACVDGRGTGGRGREFMDVVYKRLGYYETIDQVAAANYMASLPYVDASRIGIHGWSYGGYETLMAASATDSPYAAAVAVAPVTDWRYYDTIYAERYMLTPQQNADGYFQSAPLNVVNRVRCPLLIMTGTADDNVHYLNTVQYVAKCEDAGRWIDMLIFPNMNHFINGCNSQTVVYARMLAYFNQQMK